jgi:hypothetical protein
MNPSAETRAAASGHRLIDLRTAHADVVAHVLAEEEDVLQHQSDPLPQFRDRHTPDRNPVEQDLAALRLVEAHQQVDDRALPRARRPHDGDALARPARGS